MAEEGRAERSGHSYKYTQLLSLCRSSWPWVSRLAETARLPTLIMQNVEKQENVAANPSSTCSRSCRRRATTPVVLLCVPLYEQHARSRP